MTDQPLPPAGGPEDAGAAAEQADDFQADEAHDVVGGPLDAGATS